LDKLDKVGLIPLQSLVGGVEPKLEWNFPRCAKVKIPSQGPSFLVAEELHGSAFSAKAGFTYIDP
jgi:hypothetical protein